MDKPAKLVFSDEASVSIARGDILGIPVVLALALVVVLKTTDATLTELVLPFAALSFLWFGWVGLLGFVAWGHRISERRAINRMFAGEIWECWQFSSSSWQAFVETECNLISPKDEGLKAYVGAVYSSIVGIILAIIMIAVGIFAIEEPVVKTGLWIGAVAVFLLLLGIGLFQPLIARFNAIRYRRMALRVPEPRVWFSSDGVYHEALGYTSLKELEKVTDQTRFRKAIQFTLTVSTDTSTFSVPYSFPVPAGCEERAGRLVRRYRQERLHHRS